MKRFFKLWSACFVAMILMTSLFTVGFALNDAELEWLKQNITVADESGVSGNQAWISQYLTTDGLGIPLVFYNHQAVYLRDGKSEDELSGMITSSITNKNVMTDVSNITNGLNIGADTDAASTVLSGFIPILRVMLGIMAVLITVGMTVFSAFDIAYIAFPVFRNKCEDAKTAGSGVMVNGVGKLRFISDDAQFAIQQGTVESGKSPWMLYFKKRIYSYIMLAIVLFILLTGNISLITNIALKLVSGIMEILSSFA